MSLGDHFVTIRVFEHPWGPTYWPLGACSPGPGPSKSPEAPPPSCPDDSGQQSAVSLRGALPKVIEFSLPKISSTKLSPQNLSPPPPITPRGSENRDPAQVHRTAQELTTRWGAQEGHGRPRGSLLSAKGRLLSCLLIRVTQGITCLAAQGLHSEIRLPSSTGGLTSKNKHGHVLVGEGVNHLYTPPSLLQVNHQL